ncbi:MAG: TIM-barrel domain-containing protein [Armatimonadota bacterium]
MQFLLGVIMTSAGNQPKTNWTEIQPGIWRAQIGSADKPTLTDAGRTKAKTERLAAMPKGRLPFALESVGLKKSKNFATVHIPLGKGEKIFGLGLQMKGADRRKGIYHLRVDHYDQGNDRLHVPTPLYVSSAGYAVFLNTSRPTNFYVGIGNRLDDANRPPFRDRNTDRKWDDQPPSEWVEASVEAPGLEVIVLTGPTAMDAIRRYNLLCGGGAMPPMWALGFWHRTPSLATAQQVLDEANEFEKRGFPLDVIGLEPGWQTRSYPGSMEWSKERFPDPPGFLTKLGEKGIKVNLWENPYVAPQTELFTALGDKFGSHTVWLGGAPDVLDKKARKTVQDFHAAKHPGVSGYKIDEVDGFDVWLWPDHAEFKSGPDGLQMRQIYGVLWQELLLDMYKKKNERTFGLVRASNGGASHLPFAIYSDTYDHRQYVTALTSSSLAGTLWCAEIRSASSPEEWVRRMQSACLSPIAQLNAWADGTKPWSFPTVNENVKEAMLLRESLVPYLYTAFAQYAMDGTPPIRPMSLVDGGTETDQYMIGDSLLAAPMFTGETSRTVRLPKGKWYEYANGKLVGENEKITVKPGLSEIPLYVREGSAIPTFAKAKNVAQALTAGKLTLRCYGLGPIEGRVYEDDGKSFGYEKGDFGLFRVVVRDEAPDAQSIGGLRKELRSKLEVLSVGRN